MTNSIDPPLARQISPRRAWVVALLALLAGCTGSLPTMPWQKMPLDVASGLYDDAALTYRLDAGKLGQPLDVVRVEGQRVSYEQVASSPLAEESIGTLSVAYPHPLKGADAALARFMLDSAPAESKSKPTPWNPLAAQDTSQSAAPTTVAGSQPEVHETWELDITHQELDALFKQITSVGFYQLDRPGPTRLTVKLNGRQQSKDWEQIPALNLLIQRIRSQGRLVAYARPAGSVGSATASIASTQAYAQFLAGTGTPGTPPPVVTNAFALIGTGVAGAGGHPPVPPPPAYPSTTYPQNLAQRPPATR